MKVLLTANTYYPFQDGVSVVTTYQAEGLVRKGHQVIVLTSACEGRPEKETVNGVEIIRDNIRTVHAIHRGGKREYQKRIIAWSNEVDVIVNVCTQTARTDWMVPVLDQITCPAFLYLHGMTDFSWNKVYLTSVKSVCSKLWNNLRWGWFYKLQAENFRKYARVSQLHECDRGNRYFCKKYGIQGEIIGNAADGLFFEKYEEKKAEEPYMVCIANYVEGKNQMLCLEAFYRARLPKEWKLLFVGSSETEYYRRLIEKKEELEQKWEQKREISFLVGVSRKEIASIVAGAEIYLFGSKWEVFPLSIVEAMAAGVPFISTDAGCVRYLPGGVIVKNAEDMAYWMERFSEEKMLREYMGKMGHIYARRHFQIQDKVDEFEKNLRELCNKNK